MTLPEIVRLMAGSRSLLPVTIDKVGLVKWRELQERRMTIEELEAYADAPAWAHITGSISGLFTIDVDSTGMEWAKYQELDKLAHRKTPSGGLHVDVVLPRGWASVKNTVGALSAGIDTRGEGGIALIWGRSRKGGYEWLRPFSESPIPFLTLPLKVQWALFENCRPQEQRIVEVDFSKPPSKDEVHNLLLKALSYAPAHGRNSTGFWLARKLRDSAVEKERARLVGYAYVNRVWSTNTHGATEPYTQRMFDAALDNAYARIGR